MTWNSQISKPDIPFQRGRPAEEHSTRHYWLQVLLDAGAVPALGCRHIFHPRCESAGQEWQTHRERKSGVLSPPRQGMGNPALGTLQTPPQRHLNARKTVSTVRSQALRLSLSFTNQATPSCSLYCSTCCGLAVSLLLEAVTQAQEDFNDRSGAELRASLPHHVPFRTPVKLFATTLPNEALLWVWSFSPSAGLHPGSLCYSLF